MAKPPGGAAIVRKKKEKRKKKKNKKKEQKRRKRRNQETCAINTTSRTTSACKLMFFWVSAAASLSFVPCVPRSPPRLRMKRKHRKNAAQQTNFVEADADIRTKRFRKEDINISCTIQRRIGTSGRFRIVWHVVLKCAVRSVHRAVHWFALCSTLMCTTVPKLWAVSLLLLATGADGTITTGQQATK
jgi:hypothetical protein